MSDPFPLERARARRRSTPTARAPWLKDCICDERGRIIPNLANVLIALRAAPELADAFAYDLMLCVSVLMKELPIAPNAEIASCDPVPRPVRDHDVSQLQEFLQHNGITKVGKDTAHQAVDQRAQERSFHPVREYLDNLKWDGVKRLDGWTIRYLGADPGDYSAKVGRMFLIAMVARIYEPGCKADHMIVLEGDQGVGKSTACRVLAGEWFSDNLPDVRDKDSAQHIRGKWLVEIAELAAIGKAEAETLKSFISRQIERFRPAYGRKEAIEPRQCVFVGTTNRSVYLKDETGARRFWPIKVSKVDIEGLESARDQLFAEAFTSYCAGEKWWPNQSFERNHIRPQQQARYETDPWELAISDYVDNLSRVTVQDIARDVLHMEEISRIGTADQRRITAVLVDKGWQSGRDWRGRFYVSPNAAKTFPSSNARREKEEETNEF
jgi:predicted P-loop ATPase